jgi:aspartate-semialdehyde dehydrogenase
MSTVTQSNQSRHRSGSMSAPRVAIAGVTGAVGQELLKILAERSFPVGQLTPLASARSVGKQVEFGGKRYPIQELTEDSFRGVDLALFSAGGAQSRKFAPLAVAAGAVVVDNSSAFRMDPAVPLVVPEVNPEDLAGMRLGQPAIIANPNCSTIIMLVPVTPLHRAATVQGMVVSTYQAASGAGAKAMAELEQQTRDVLAGKPPVCVQFPQQYAFNIFSHDSDVGPAGYNTEEMKMVHETHKMWHAQSVAITATCVRVPVMRAHAESINLQFERPLSEAEAYEILHAAPGVTVVDDRGANRFPTPLHASGKDDVYAGRIRSDIAGDGGMSETGLNLFVCGDQIRKGAALNAVQIAEMLL